MKDYKNFETIAKFWLAELEKYNEEPFKKKPDEKSWSLGELYAHLYQSTLYYLKNIDFCIEKKEGQTGGSKNFKGKLTYLQSGFLPVKYRLSINEKHPPEMPEDIMAMRDKLIKLMKLMYLTAEKIEGLSKEDLKYKTKNPGFGFLNANEWYQLAEMHFRHHAKQKNRLETFISKR
jgi:hypothetical protein